MWGPAVLGIFSVLYSICLAVRHFLHGQRSIVQEKIHQLWLLQKPGSFADSVTMAKYTMEQRGYAEQLKMYQGYLDAPWYEQISGAPTITQEVMICEVSSNYLFRTWRQR